MATPAMTKRCSTCHLEQDLAQFNKRVSAPDGHQPRCRSCSRAWYQANKVGHKIRVAERNRRVRDDYSARITGYLLEHPCVDCGESDLRCLDFDHVRGTKVREVGGLLATRVRWSTIVTEIEKCDVRCSNCHRRVTAERSGNHRQRAFERYAIDTHDQALARLTAVLTR